MFLRFVDCITSLELGEGVELWLLLGGLVLDPRADHVGLLLVHVPVAAAGAGALVLQQPALVLSCSRRLIVDPDLLPWLILVWLLMLLLMLLMSPHGSGSALRRPHSSHMLGAVVVNVVPCGVAIQ